MPTLIYAGFWRRAFALLVDFAVFVVVMVPYHVLLGRSIPAAMVALLALTAFSVAYPVYFLSRWGQTLGKMAAGVRVVRLDGDPIALRHAWFRTSVDIALWLAYCIGGLFVLATWTGREWSSLAWHERGVALAELSPTDALYYWASTVWAWSELVVILFNRKRRAPHDFIAGTVVIKIRTRPAIPPWPGHEQISEGVVQGGPGKR